MPKGGRSKKKKAADYVRIESDAKPSLDEYEPTGTWVVLRSNERNGGAKNYWRADLD